MDGLTGEQVAVGTDSWFASTGLGRMFPVSKVGCHMGYIPESPYVINNNASLLIFNLKMLILTDLLNIYVPESISSRI